MSILLFTIISMSENERRHNAKSAMSGLSHFYRPAPLSADQLLRKTRPIVEIKQWQCIVCVTKLRPMLKANYCIVMYRVVSGQNAPIVWVIQLDWNAQFYTKKVYENFVCRSNRLRVHHPQTSYLSFFSTQIFSTQIFLHIDLAQKRHKLW